MSTPDDERFEHYLKQFRPLAPEALHTEKRGRAARRLSVLAAWAAAVVVVLIAAVLLTRPRSKPTHSVDVSGNSAEVGQLGNPQPLTIGSVNALLACAPSFKTAVDKVAFQPRPRQLANGTQSALAVLSKEDTKL